MDWIAAGDAQARTRFEPAVVANLSAAARLSRVAGVLIVFALRRSDCAQLMNFSKPRPRQSLVCDPRVILSCSRSQLASPQPSV